MTPPRGHQGARERKGMVISGPHEAALLLTLRAVVCTSQLHGTYVTTGTRGQRAGPGAEALCPFLSRHVHGQNARRCPAPHRRSQGQVQSCGWNRQCGHPVGAVRVLCPRRPATPGPREAARAGQCTFAFQGPPGRQQAGPALPTALTRQRGVPQPHPAQRRGERPLGGPSSARARGGSGTFVCPQTGFERVGLWGVLSSVFSCLVRSVFINDVQRP